MASGFPGAIDNFSDPLANSPLNSPSHATLHSDVNDAVEKIETYMGLVKVIPTGATNGTVSATGTVTIGNAVSSVTVSGAFSSLYDNYRIIYSGGTASGLALLYCYMGATSPGNSYYGTRVSATIAGVANSTGDNNVGSWSFMNAISTVGSVTTFDLYQPNLAARTYIASDYFELNTGSSTFGRYAGYLNNATSYTSFTLQCQSPQTLTGGTIRVYGYRN